MNDPIQFAQILTNAINIREKSYDHGKAKKLMASDSSRDFCVCYSKSKLEAATEACGEDNAVFIPIIHTLIENSWNESTIWATEVLSTVEA